MADPDPNTDPAPVDPVANTLDAGRQNAGSDTFGTVSPSYEERIIILAEGVEAHESRFSDLCAKSSEANAAKKYVLKDFLQDKLQDAVTFDDDGTIHYTSDKQNVRFTVKMIYTKSEFKIALGTPGVHIVYDGHARYGRGPCFGKIDDPGQRWGDGDNDEGLWRMGFPYIAIPVHDVLEHQYTAAPLLGVSPKPDKSDCHPDIQAHYSSLKQIALKDCSKDPTELATLTQLLSATGDQDETYWGWWDTEDKIYQPFLINLAGWQNTSCKDNDLGSADLKCKVFCHFGCRSRDSNYPVLRKLDAWTRTEDDRFAYWTTSYSNVLLHSRWIYRIFTYDQPNAGESWKKSLDYAVIKTNQDLGNLGCTYQVW